MDAITLQPAVSAGELTGICSSAPIWNQRNPRRRSDSGSARGTTRLRRHLRLRRREPKVNAVRHGGRPSPRMNEHVAGLMLKSQHPGRLRGRSQIADLLRQGGLLYGRRQRERWWARPAPATSTRRHASTTQDFPPPRRQRPRLARGLQKALEPFASRDRHQA
jgi:hypothetical protein